VKNEMNEVNNAPVSLSTPIEGNTLHSNATEIIETTNSTPSSINLVYSAKDSEKYLRKSKIQKDTASGKKLTTVEILLTVADNVKHGENGLGDLRQIKDEMFTFNFHDDKRNKN
jgi:hypothetical protein